MASRVVCRNDLVVSERNEDGDLYYLVQDPFSSETYRFGEQEWYLLQNMDGATSSDELIEKIYAKYDTRITPEELDSFIDMVGSWGIVTKYDGSKVGDVERSSSSVYDDLIEMPAATDVAKLITTDRTFQSRPARPRVAATETADVDWVLFNPNRFFSRLYRLLHPLRWLRYPIPLLVLIASAIIFNNLQIFIYDFLRLRSPLSIIQILVFSMFTVNLLTQLGRGVIARSVSVDVNQFGVHLVFGVLPRFSIDTANLGNLARKQKLVYYSGPLLIRLALFGFSTMFWLAFRPTGTFLSSIFLMMLCVSAFSFFLATNPLYNSDGYKVLTTLLEMPNLRQKANLALFGENGNLLAERMLRDDNLFALRAYALSSIIFLFILLGAILILSARWFEFNYQGTGVVIYLSLAIYLVWRLYSRFVTKRNEMKEKRTKIEAAMAGRGNQNQAAGTQRPTRRNRNAGNKTGWRNRLQTRGMRYVLLLAFLAVLFLPYPYETGGVLQVLPDKQNEIYAETPGIITSVLVNSGEFIKAGTVVASLSSFEQVKNMLTTQASLLEQQSKLEQLRTTPTEEDIELAKTKLSTAKTHYKYTLESAKRLEALYKDGNVSLDDYQDEQKQMDVDRMQVDEAQANLKKVVAGPHPKEIEAAEFELERLQEQLKFEKEDLARTKLVMPMNGHIVTTNLDHMVGQYLDEGDHFVTVENDEHVRIEIQVPESDISDVVLGADARFKVWSHGDRLFYGNVSEIAPTALEETYGKVVVVTLVIPNKNHELKSGMTGFGKVDGGTKLVIVAFTRMLVRFFTIEMWSWIP